jgi:hypothetical protein
MAKVIELGQKYPCASEGFVVPVDDRESMLAAGDILEVWFAADNDISSIAAAETIAEVVRMKNDYPEFVLHYVKVETRKITIQYSVAPVGASHSPIVVALVWKIVAAIATLIGVVLVAYAIYIAIQKQYLFPAKQPLGNAVVVAKNRVDGSLLPNVKISTDGLEGITGASGEGVLFEDLLEGDHVFIGEAIEGYDTPNPITAYITADKTTNVMIPYNPEGSVPPTHGWLDVNTDPVKGTVFIDSADKGEAPISSYETIGDHSVAFGTVEGYITPEPRTVTVQGDPFRTPVIGYYTKPVVWWEKYLKYALIGGGAILGAALIIPEAIRAITRRGERKE